MTETVLVIGGAGLIGSHVCRKLLERGFRVVIYDNQKAYDFNTLDRFGVPYKDCLIVSGDIRNKDLLERVIKGSQRVIHLASLSDVGACIRDPQLNFDIDIVGGFNVVSLCLKHGIKKLVFASSASVYGSPDWIDGKPPMVSEKDAVYPTTPYANTKLFNETQLRLWYEQYGLPTTSLRYFSVWGVPQTPKQGSHSWNMAIFSMKALKGNHLTLFGGGNQVRDYTHVEDIAEATVQCIYNNSTDGKVFNVGTGKPTSVKETAELILKLTESSSRILTANQVLGDPKGCYADNSLMKELLGWVPTKTIDEMLPEYIAWIKSNSENIPEWI
ncbi:MAG: NAD-dependent epimerase/dehydratase family protein [Candidatus Daviesbacteria bacterium]|nr:NAD-dependent epimerase/dehydratase family protein [Candidatus Daviesbacteria bacterium]